MLCKWTVGVFRSVSSVHCSLHPSWCIIIIIIIIIIIQDQVTLTSNYKKHILKQPNTDELCRRCGKESETIQHITAACEQLAPTEYVKRHDGEAKVIHQKLAEAAELIEDKSPYYRVAHEKPARRLVDQRGRRSRTLYRKLNKCKCKVPTV